MLEFSPYRNTLYIGSEDAAIVQEDRVTLWSWLGPYDARLGDWVIKQIRHFHPEWPRIGPAMDRETMQNVGEP